MPGDSKIDCLHGCVKFDRKDADCMITWEMKQIEQS